MLHLVKLCVGIDTVSQLQAWQRKRAAERRGEGLDPRPRHCTRNMPRRREELLAGGSLYWVVRRRIVVRQRIVEINREEDATGRSLAELVLDPALVLTLPVPRRPFQGWRYFPEADAPADLAGAGDRSAFGRLPQEMRAALDEIGVR